MSDDPRVPMARERTDLAYFRTLWAAERTLLAWIRTSLTMVSFGFAIEKVVGLLEQESGLTNLGQGYYWLGLSLVSVGIILLVLAMVEHRGTSKQLRLVLGREETRFSLPMLGASIVMFIGLTALALILLRWPEGMG